MATTTKERAPRNLKPADVLAAEEATAAQKTAREANTVELTNAVRDIIGEYVNAERATAKASAEWIKTKEGLDATQQHKLEGAYVALAKLSHDNDMPEDMCKTVLDAALLHFYSAEQLKSGVSSAGKLRTQLARAMHPQVRANLPAIVKPWADAWETETKAKDAKRDAATPLREKFHSRGVAITQALQLAADKKASVKLARPADVLTWVKEHPRKARAATTPATAIATVATTGMSDMDAASAKVDALIAAVKTVSEEYGDPDCFVAVLDALAKCTAKVMIRKPASEPVRGVVDIDDALMEEFKAFQAMRAKANEANGK